MPIIKSYDDLTKASEILKTIDNEKFKKIVNDVIKNDEGEYSNDKDDNGGETKYGITKSSYPFLNIKEITIDQAIAIYYFNWWEFYHFDLIDSFDFQKKLFSISINMGFNRAFSILQDSINELISKKIKVDGLIGKESLFSINKELNNKLVILMEIYKIKLIKYYKSLGNDKFISGWINRINR